MQSLATALNFRALRQKIISSNIANADTPGFKAKRLEFEDALQKALNVNGDNALTVQDPQHYNVGGGGFGNLQPEVYEDPNGVVSADGNTVDREDEMARLTENKILYDTAIQLMNKKIGMMKYAINQEK